MNCFDNSPQYCDPSNSNNKTAKEAAEEAAKKILEEEAKEEAEEAVEKAAEKAAKEQAEKTAKELAEKTAKITAKEIEEKIRKIDKKKLYANCAQLNKINFKPNFQKLENRDTDYIKNVFVKYEFCKLANKTTNYKKIYKDDFKKGAHVPDNPANKQYLNELWAKFADKKDPKKYLDFDSFVKSFNYISKNPPPQ